MNQTGERAATLRQRLLAFLCVALAVALGLVGFASGGAPNSYIIVNGAGLAVVASVLIPGGPGRTRIVPPLIALLGLALIVATLFVGPEVEGVQRWIRIGPLTLHAGMLVLPAMIATFVRQRPTVSLPATVICAAVFSLQPDLGSALALFGGLALTMVGRRLAFAEVAMCLIALAAVLATALRPDSLAPVPFVETALIDAWRTSPPLGVAMAAALAMAIILPPRLLVRRNPDLGASARGVIGALGGFAVAPLFGPFPQPLIGYGASPIIGLGLALAVLRFGR